MAVLPRRARLILLIFGGLLPVVCYGAVRIALKVNIRHARDDLAMADDSGSAPGDLGPDSDLLGEKGQLDRKRVDMLLADAEACLLAERVSVSALGGRDPFRQASEEDARGAAPSTLQIDGQETVLVPRLHLDGILWDEAGAVALINGQVVREGDTVGQGMAVATIGPQSVTVTVTHGGQEVTTELVLDAR